MNFIHFWIVLLGNPWYKYGFLTFVATFISLVVKLSSRPDGIEMQLEDLAVGLDLAQVAVFAIVSDGVADVVHAIVVEGKLQFDLPTVEKLVAIPSLAGAMIMFLFFVALLVRKYGWHYDGSEWRLNDWGAFGPLPVGMLYLVVSIIFIGGA